MVHPKLRRRLGKKIYYLKGTKPRSESKIKRSQKFWRSRGFNALLVRTKEGWWVYTRRR